ncbi:MAG: hypothetical protein IT581_16145 [Verrucomicrobiales bacterium]|nr:hypothetical protein [Verrucomicrobiales bacterium]
MKNGPHFLLGCRSTCRLSLPFKLAVLCWLAASSAFGSPSLTLVRDINQEPGRIITTVRHDVTFGDGRFLTISFDDQLRELYLGTFDGHSAARVFARIPHGGSPNSYWNRPDNWMALGSKTVFTASSLGSGIEPWVTDGTESGTVMLKDIFPGILDSNPGFLTRCGSEIFFFAGENEGLALWKTDGTQGGTRRVKLFPSREGLISPTRAQGNDELFFFIDKKEREPSRVWRSDGTEAGTFQVYATGEWADTFESVNTLVTLPDRAIFLQTSLAYAFTNWLWSSDGTQAGTKPIYSFGPSAAEGISGVTISQVGNLAVFAARGTNGLELWRTDGTTNGTMELADLWKGEESSKPEKFTVADGTVFFLAEQPATGRELWQTDGKSVRLVDDLAPGSASSKINFLVSIHDTAFFTTDREDEDRLWKTTVLGVQEIRMPASTQVLTLEVYGDFLYVTLLGGAVYQMHWTEAALDSTSRPGPSSVVTDSSYPMDFTRMGDLLLFSALDATRGRHLWRSDGTPDGTWRVREIRVNGSSESVDVSGIVAGDSIAYFQVKDAATGYRGLWRSDGTELGTWLIREGLDSQFKWNPRAALIAGTRLYFFDGPPNRLWSSDGTAEGTRPIGDFEFPENASQFLGAVGSRVIFSVYDANSSEEAIWVSDGTVGGTMKIKDALESWSLWPNSFPGGFIVFALSDEEHGAELWRSDGTASGTVRVADLQPGPEGSISRLPGIQAGGTHYFEADDGVHGAELWRTDGTPEGTVLVQDLEVGEEGSNLQLISEWNGRLLFISLDVLGQPTLWSTDGSGDGTRRLSKYKFAQSMWVELAFGDDLLIRETFVGETKWWRAPILPGEGGSDLIPAFEWGAVHPSGFMEVNGNLFFAADGIWVGNELFALTLPPPAMTVRLEGGKIRVIVSGKPRSNYMLERSPSILGPWTVIREVAAGTDGDVVIEESTQPGSGFFRLR